MADDITPPSGFSLVAPPSPSPAGGDIAPPPGFSLVGGNSGASQPAGSTLKDIGRGVGLGLQEGAATVLGFPSDVWQMLDRGYQWALTKGAEKVGMITPEQGAAMRQPVPGVEDYHYTSQAIMDRFRKWDEGLGASTEPPKTVPGQYAETAGQFGLGAAALGAGELKQVPGAIAKYGLLPGAASETAGQVTKGTPLEPYARVAGAVAGSSPGMAFDALRSGTRAAATAADSLAPQQQQAAQALLDQSRTAGIPLTVPEAVQHVSNGSTSLGDIQRVVEQSTKGGPQMRQFYADRPTQVEQAARQTLGQIASPSNVSPEETAANVQKAAGDTVSDADRARTQAVNPYYQAAATNQVPATDMEALLGRIDTMAGADKTGILSPTLTRLRDSLVQDAAKPAVPPQPTGLLDASGNPMMTPGTPAVPRTPITDVENLDRVRKYFRDQMDQPQWTQDAIPKEANSKVGSVLDELNSMMQTHSYPFARGRQLYQDISSAAVDPLMRSPTGQLAFADTYPKQASILFKQNPTPGSEVAVGNAIRSVVAKDPAAAAQLVRLHIEQTFNEATQQLRSGANQWGGAKFVSTLAGNPQQAANLEAAVRALPNGDLRWNSLNNTLQILRAQGTRQPVGSQTEFNRLLVQELRGGSPLGSVMATAASPTRLARFASDVYQNFMYGRNTAKLADLFTTGNVEDLRRLALAPAKSISGQAGIAALLGEGADQQSSGSNGRADGGSVREPDGLDAIIDEASSKYGVSGPLIRRVMMVESGGKRGAVSNQGALGPMQLMPATAKALGVTDPFDYDQAINAGAKLLRQGLDRNDGRVDQAVAEYHGGPNRANWGPKTAAYVTKVLGGGGGEGPSASPARSPAPAEELAAARPPLPSLPTDLGDETEPVTATSEQDNALDRMLSTEGMNLLAASSGATA